MTMTTESTDTRRADLRARPSWIANQLRRLFRHAMNRRSFRRMLALDDHQLTDIGVTRGDVIRAAKLPFHKSPADELRRTSGRL